MSEEFEKEAEFVSFLNQKWNLNFSNIEMLIVC